MAKIGIIGAGSWGIALSVLLHNNGHEITVWSILEDEINMLKTEHEHKDKLPGVKLPEDMVFTTSLPEAIEGYSGVGSSITFYKKYIPQYEAVCSGRTDHSQCSQGYRGTYSYDPVSDY